MLKFLVLKNSRKPIKKYQKKAEELQKAIDRLCIIEVELKAKLVND